MERVGQRLASGDLQDIKAVPTSEKTAEQARSLGIPLTTLNKDPSLSVAIDGADTAVAETFGLVKGGGGALLREKLVAAAAQDFIVIVDDSKIAEGLGAAFALPVEIIQYAHEHVRRQVESLPSLSGCQAKLRLKEDQSPYVTDNGNYIVDLHFRKPIAVPQQAAIEISAVVGVVEHGLFLDMATTMVVAAPGGVRVITAEGL